MQLQERLTLHRCPACMLPGICLCWLHCPPPPGGRAPSQQTASLCAWEHSADRRLSCSHATPRRMHVTHTNSRLCSSRSGLYCAAVQHACCCGSVVAAHRSTGHTRGRRLLGMPLCTCLTKSAQSCRQKVGAQQHFTEMGPAHIR
jgi:hypothetical protein